MTEPFKLDDLITPLTRLQVQASIYSVLGTLGVNTTTWKPGAVVRTMIVGVSLVLAGLSTLQAQIARAGFLELSEKKWLTAVARYVYGVERIEATFAGGEVLLTNSGGGVFEVGIDDLIVKNPVSGVSYRNVAAFSLGAFGSPTAATVVSVQAIEAGATISLPGTITELVTPLAHVTCTNAGALVGLEAEADPVLRARCAEMLGALSPMGPWDAYTAAVRNAAYPDGTRLGVTRSRITKDGYGNVTIYLATAGGAVSAEDLAVADEAIQQNAAPLAVAAHTLSATPIAVPVTYELWMYNTSGRSVAEVEALISARLVRFFETQPIGGNVITSGGAGRLYVDALRAVIGDTLTQIFHVVVSAPAADLTLTIDEVPTCGVPTAIAIHQTAPPEGQVT